MKKNKTALFYLLPLIAILLLLFLNWQRLQTNTTHSSSVSQDNALPIIHLPALPPSTKPFTSQTFRGKICLLTIWASWCPACRAEHRILMTIKAHYAIPLYGINFKDNTEHATTWLTKEGDPFTEIGVDADGAMTTALGIDDIPETFLLDQQGVIRYRFRGALTIDDLENIMLPLIEKITHEQ